MTEANTLTDAERLAIRAKLAQAMGFNVYIVTYPLGIEWYVQDSDHDGDRFLPNPFISAADKDALLRWLAADDCRWVHFKRALDSQTREEYWKIPEDKRSRTLPYRSWLERREMTAPLETITLAAAAALDITAPPPEAAPAPALPEAPRRE